MSRGQIPNNVFTSLASLGEYIPSYSLSTNNASQYYDYIIRYQNNRLTVSDVVSGVIHERIVTPFVDLAAVCDSKTAWMGFTAFSSGATGAATDHIIRDWQVRYL